MPIPRTARISRSYSPVVHSAEPTEGNSRLTAITGLIILGLFAAQIVTVLLGVTNVLTAHVWIGLTMVPPALLKIGSAGWRVVHYYRGDPDYQRRGAPPAFQRVLGPILAILAVVLLGAGVLTFVGPHAWHNNLLLVHEVAAYGFLAATALHLVPHFLEAVRLAAADLFRRARARVPGTAARLTALAVALAAGAVLAATLSHHVGIYLTHYPHH